MKRPPPTRKWFFVAGLLAWVAIAQPFLLPLLREPRTIIDIHVALGLAAHIAYVSAFLASTTRLEKLSPSARVALLLVQSASSLALIHLRSLWLEAGLLAIVAAQASLLLSHRFALAWAIGQTVLVFPYYLDRADILQAAFWTAGVLGFQLFATTIGYIARYEAEARIELSRLNTDLRAAEIMLEESARTAERLRIARELHDAVGHHLTALSIQIELARHACPDEGTLVEAQGITKSMLQEVRAVVREMRNDPAMDLRSAIESLVKALPAPKTHFEVMGGAADFAALDPGLTHALFRAVQEGLTNAIRHSGAENIWISLVLEAERTTLVVRDDGRGIRQMQEGSGISGLRERIDSVGGNVSFSSTPSEGLTLTIRVPMPRGAV
jgi:signal transduction histidine kinase